MDWRSRLNDPRTIKALDKTIGWLRAWRERLDWYKRDCESTTSYEQQAEDAEFQAAEDFGKSDEELRPECFYLADVLLQYLHQPSRPWGVFHRSDLIDAVSPLLENESLPSAKELVDAVGAHLQDSLSLCRIRFEARQSSAARMSDLKPSIMRLYNPDHAKDPDEAPILPKDYSIAVDLGSVEEGVAKTSLCRTDEGRSLIFWFQADVTPAARIAFSVAVRDVMAAALSVAIQRHHAHPSLLYRSDLVDTPDGERKDSIFPQARHDGASSARSTEESEEPFCFDFGTLPLTSKCIRCFVDLVHIVFSMPGSTDSEPEETRVLRCALATMADRSTLGITPLGMVGSVAIFESCLSHSLKYRYSEHGSFVSFLSGYLELSKQERGQLDRVYQARNGFVHDVTYYEGVAVVLLAARLAWAAAHHLACQVTGVFDSKLKPPDELRESLRQILRTA